MIPVRVGKAGRPDTVDITPPTLDQGLTLERTDEDDPDRG
jgi:hypothetical protein